MITLNEYLGGKVNKRKKLIPQNKEELKNIIEQRLKESPDLDLNDIDVSDVEDMKNLFVYLNIKTIDIGGWNIDAIDKYMFWKCKKLKSVILPDSVKNIEIGAFEDCSSLTKIDIPDSVENIGISAFAHCINIANINIPNSVKSIGNYAFCGCNSLTKINIPDSVESIGRYVFYKCNKLTDITIPDSVENIESDAFYEVPHITYHGLTKYYSINPYWGAKSMN